MRKSVGKQKADRNILTQRDIDDAIAAIIASTKRKNRKLNPLEVAEKIQLAVNGLGSISKVAEKAIISSEMLRQIYSVTKCSREVKELVKSRKIESYDILHRISKLPEEEQVKVADAIISKKLNSEDVRAIVTYRREFPEENIDNVIEHVIESKNIKRYVAYFTVPNKETDMKYIRTRLNKALHKDNILSIEKKDRKGKIILNSNGKQILQKEAKKRGLTKREFLQSIV